MHEPCQWLVQSSRCIGDCYECCATFVGRDFKNIENEIQERMGIVSNLDLIQANKEAKED